MKNKKQPLQLFDAKFAKKYPEIVTSLSIGSKICGDKIMFQVFSVPTQHFMVNSLDELTEEKFLLETDREVESRKFQDKLLRTAGI